MQCGDDSQIVDWIGLALATAGFGLIAYQLRQQLTQLRLSVLQAKYSALQELNLYLVEHPDLLPLYVGGRRYASVVKMSRDDRAELARKDLIMDHLEYQFHCAMLSGKKRAMSVVESVMSNPALVEFWKSSLRGGFDPRFTATVDAVLRNHDDVEFPDET